MTLDVRGDAHGSSVRSPTRLLRDTVAADKEVPPLGQLACSVHGSVELLSRVVATESWGRLIPDRRVSPENQVP